MLTTLRNTRLGLEGQQSVLEQSIRQAQNFDQRNSFRNSRTRQGSSSSSSYRFVNLNSRKKFFIFLISPFSRNFYLIFFSSSSSSSSSSVKHTSHRNSYFDQNQLGGSPEYEDYDQGPNPNRG